METGGGEVEISAAEPEVEGDEQGQRSREPTHRRGTDQRPRSKPLHSDTRRQTRTMETLQRRHSQAIHRTHTLAAKPLAQPTNTKAVPAIKPGPPIPDCYIGTDPASSKIIIIRFQHAF